MVELELPSETRDDARGLRHRLKTNYSPCPATELVTLNPVHTPREHGIVRNFTYHHPIFDNDAVAAQRMLWNIQGRRGFGSAAATSATASMKTRCRAAVAEALEAKRPWSVARESGRINLPEDWPSPPARDAA